MKRGTSLERGLAIAGIGLWVAWALINLLSPPDYLFLVLGLALSALSLVEFLRWQAGKDSLPISGRRGKKAYPVNAWFGVGAIPTALLAIFVKIMVSGPTQTNADQSSIRFISIAALLAGGFVTSSLLVRSAERRDRMAPPPPSPSPPALSANLPPSDRARYEALLEKSGEVGLSDAEAGELGRLMAQGRGD